VERTGRQPSAKSHLVGAGPPFTKTLEGTSTLAMFGLTTVFFLATAAGWVIAGALAVFVLGDIDPKFRHAPVAAFQIELIGGTICTLLSTVVVGIAASVLRNWLSINRKAVLVTVAWGFAYPLLGRFVVSQALGRFDAESLAVSAVGWAYLVVFPLLMFFVLTKLNGQEIASRGQSAL
jgi:hypothetical protein